jgi:transcriptional regulator with XRE-family HTH domain
MSQEKFAEHVGISVDFLSLIERGRNAPSFETIERMARRLRMPVVALFDFGGHGPNRNGTDSCGRGRPLRWVGTRRGRRIWTLPQARPPVYFPNHRSIKSIKVPTAARRSILFHNQPLSVVITWWPYQALARASPSVSFRS